MVDEYMEQARTKIPLSKKQLQLLKRAKVPLDFCTHWFLV
jgi:hypothetical protein